MTPPTIEQLPPDGRWRSRAFQNRYPITDSHEVVVDSTRHVLTFAHLEADEAETAFRLYRSRTRAMAEQGYEYLLFRNEGPNAGGSIPHTHAQIMAESDGFPRPHRAAQRTETPGVRQVAAEDDIVADVPEVARFPYELWIRPVDGQGPFHEADAATLSATARMVLEASKGMRERTGDKGWNLVLHQAGGGWRFEFLSRTEKFAGLELGAEVYVNAVDADAATAYWSEWFANVRELAEGPAGTSEN